MSFGTLPHLHAPSHASHLMRRSLVRALITLTMASAAGAQAARQDSARSKAPPPIQDNSFLVEEAYNQEYGVVQHINTFQRSRDGDWLYTFTQEWPAPAQRHQLSYTVAVLGAPDNGRGAGDLKLNYRYQALGAEGERLWMSPRITAILPTGDVGAGRGAGGVGVEVALPVSYEIGAVVTHWDVGGSLTRARGLSGPRQSTRAVNLAASAVWLVTPTLNLMLETAWTRGESLDDTGIRSTTRDFLVSPGVRGAINFASGLQVVPGIAVPIGVGPSRGQRDVFLYLSFEHSFR